MLSGLPLVFREPLLGSKAEASCKTLSIPDFVFKSSESTDRSIVDAWKVSSGKAQEAGRERGNMREKAFFTIFLLPSPTKIHRSVWNMSKLWDFYEQLWLPTCFGGSIFRSGQHLENVGKLILELPRDGVGYRISVHN